MLIPSKPVIDIQLEPIETTIRRERTRIQDVEFETGVMPSTWMLEYMINCRKHGVTGFPINL